MDDINTLALALSEGVLTEQLRLEAGSVDEFYSYRLAKKNYIEKINEDLEKSYSKNG